MSIKTIFTESEFCREVNISRVTAWRLRNEGKLPHCRVGSKILYTLEHIAQFLKGFEQPLKNKNGVRR